MNIHSTRVTTDSAKTIAVKKWIIFTQPITKCWPAGPLTMMNGWPM